MTIELRFLLRLSAFASIAATAVFARADDDLIAPQVRLARDQVFPAVVRIDVHTRTYAEGEKEIVRGTGSGVIISTDGYILTNYHVAGRAEKLIVTLVDKERVRARLVGSDHWTDLAIIRLDPDEVRRKGAKLTAATLGDSSKTTIGEQVLAIGTPFGLSRTMTVGVVTNNDRYFSGETINGYETGEFNNWLQTDAAINPGNSGGPLVNMRGEVIGINTRGLALAEGLGFAVPINVAKSVSGRILRGGRVVRSYIGVQFRELLDLETHYGLQANRGVLIESVDPRSPAHVAGIRPEDVLLSIDGTAVSARFPEELPAVRKLIAEHAVGSELHLTIKRGVNDRETDVVVKSTALESAVAEDEREFAEWGLTARSITAMYAARQRLPDRAGALVTGVKMASVAQRAGLEIDDIIRSVGRQEVRTLADLERLLKAPSGGPDQKPPRILVEVLRGSAVQILVLKPDERAPRDAGPSNDHARREAAPADEQPKREPGQPKRPPRPDNHGQGSD